MQPPRERLPEQKDEILAPGARLKIEVNEGSGGPDVQIRGNRLGLKAFAAICTGLAELRAEELSTPANHYHLDEDFWGTEKGSVPLTIWCREGGWPEIPSKTL